MTDTLYPASSRELAEKRRALAPEIEKAFQAFSRQVFTDGALPGKTKQLIAVAVAHVTHCPYCIRGHTKAALRQGATRRMSSLATPSQLPGSDFRQKPIAATRNPTSLSRLSIPGQGAGGHRRERRTRAQIDLALLVSGPWERQRVRECRSARRHGAAGTLLPRSGACAPPFACSTWPRQ
jgi:AhpD family alkylhydroperoxidase